MSVVLDLSFTVCIWISAAVAVTYTLLGGLYSVAYTDIIQLVLIFLGLVRVIYVCVHGEKTMCQTSKQPRPIVRCQECVERLLLWSLSSQRHFNMLAQFLSFVLHNQHTNGHQSHFSLLISHIELSSANTVLFTGFFICSRGDLSDQLWYITDTCTHRINDRSKCLWLSRLIER